MRPVVTNGRRVGAGVVRPTGHRAAGVEAGFTLLEVLVALTLTGIVALLIHVGFGTTADLTAMVAERDSVTARSATVRQQILAWVGGAYVTGPDQPSFSVSDGRSGTLHDDHLVVPTRSSGPFSDRPAVVRLRVEREGSTGRGLIAELAGHRPPGSSERLELVPEATGLDVRVLYEMNQRREWFSGWNSLVQLPDAVELRLSGDSLPNLLRMPMLAVLPGHDG